MKTRLTPRILLLLCLTAMTSMAENEAAFRKAEPGYGYEFPRDHGSHPQFKLEWWYLTGHLRAKGTDRRFGFQATFFRAALDPEENASSGSGRYFDNSQAFLAHVALLDAATGALHVEERLNRQGWDARASATDLAVRNGNWTLTRTPVGGENEAMHLQASILADAQLDLTLVPAKPKVIFGEDGISRKSASSDAASHYITFPRLTTSGSIRLLGMEYEVDGESWMDHEFSSSQLGPEQIGWDWAGIQLNDGREIMLYRLRQEGGGIDPFSQLTWVDRQSKQHRVELEDWRWSARRQWISSETGAIYPIDFDLVTIDPSSEKERRFRLRPLHDAQEIAAKLDQISYWEGACEVVDESGAVIGQAYVELTGYDGHLGERLR